MTAERLARPPEAEGGFSSVAVDAAAILGAPEIGPVADAGTMDDAVRRMRVVPIGEAAIAKIVVPIALPMVVVVALRVPTGELLPKLVKTVL
jgi:hypothetical protein